MTDTRLSNNSLISDLFLLIRESYIDFVSPECKPLQITIYNVLKQENLNGSERKITLDAKSSRTIRL